MPFLPERGHLTQDRGGSDSLYSDPGPKPGSLCSATFMRVSPPSVPDPWKSLRKGYTVSFLGEEAEVTDSGVCLRQCDQQAANLRLGFESPDFWVCLHSALVM